MEDEFEKLLAAMKQYANVKRHHESGCKTCAVEPGYSRALEGAEVEKSAGKLKDIFDSYIKARIDDFLTDREMP